MTHKTTLREIREQQTEQLVRILKTSTRHSRLVTRWVFGVWNGRCFLSNGHFLHFADPRVHYAVQQSLGLPEQNGVWHVASGTFDPDAQVTLDGIVPASDGWHEVTDLRLTYQRTAQSPAERWFFDEMSGEILSVDPLYAPLLEGDRLRWHQPGTRAGVFTTGHKGELETLVLPFIAVYDRTVEWQPITSRMARMVSPPPREKVAR